MGTYATSGACLIKAGINVSSELTSGAGVSFGNPDVNTSDEVWDMWIAQAEAFINVATRKNWTDDYGTLDGDVKYVLEQAATDLCGIFAITFDMSGYTSRGEAESMINILRDDFLRCIGILRDLKQQDFMDGA